MWQAPPRYNPSLPPRRGTEVAGTGSTRNRLGGASRDVGANPTPSAILRSTCSIRCSLLRLGMNETGGCLVGILQGRKGLILGVANEKSIAWGVARACHREGAELGFNYLGEALMKRVHPLAESIHSSFVEPLDVGDDAQLDDFFAKVEARWGRLGFTGPSIAFSNT